MKLSLVNIDAEVAAELHALPAGQDEWRQLSLGGLGTLVREVLDLNEGIRQSRWGGYLSIDDERRLVVGTCAFKGRPDAAGAVEIAYFTFPGHEARGYATAMARELVGIAERSGEVSLVVAHTLREENASVRLLRKLAFRGPRDVEDPEDGAIWRWERALL